MQSISMPHHEKFLAVYDSVKDSKGGKVGH